MTILVTGATGFIGRHLIERLAGRHDVVAIARSEPPAALADAARWIRQDLSHPLDVNALPARVDTVLHLAQSARYREFPDAVDDVLAINVAAPVALLDYARRAGAGRFVLCSTGGVYGYRGEPAREEDPVAPIGFYQASKYAAEVLLEPYGELLTTVVLRPFFVYGPGQRGQLVGALAERVLNGQTVTVHGDPGPRVNPLHVDDAARAIAAALELDAPAVINLAGDDVTSIADLARKLADAAGVEPRIEYDAAGDAGGDLLAANGRMKELLGVVPEVPLAAGLRGVVEKLRA